GLAAPPQRIEGFDISNISGTFAVASLVRFKGGRPDRSNYRRFRIKTVTGQDDFASMAEVVRRRYTRLLSESKVQSPKPKVGDDGGDAIPQALQEMVDDVSAAAKRRRLKANSDAAAADVKARRAPGIEPSASRTNLPDLIVIDGGKGQLNM